MEKYILVIEDDPILGKVALKAAEQLNLKAVLDNDGNKYPALLKTHGPPALFLIDLHLPFASGAELLKEFRSNPALAAIPMIILTADIYQSRLLEEQGERVLLKPVSLARLQEILAQVM
jgi:CheY-like chemotaxis protein